MTEVFSRLTAVPSCHPSNEILEEDYDLQLRELVAYIKQPRRTAEIASAAEHLLNDLDPSLHSAAYLFVLHAQVKTLRDRYNELLPEDIHPGGRLWSRALEFLRTFDPIQVRYAGHEWRQLIELVAQAAQAASKTLLAVQVIRDAILRLDPASETFTSTHLLFAKLCLLTKSYRHALPVLNRCICHFPIDSAHENQTHQGSSLCSRHESSISYITLASGLSAKMTYKDHLQYFLYGAMIYIALKDWDRALHFLSIVISCPVTNTVSKIMVEAYKKWLLVSLLGKGKVISPPEIISPHVMKIYQSLTLPYTCLTSMFESEDIQRLRAEVEVGRTIWITDHNMGLVLQAVSALGKFVVVKLGNSLSAVAIADVAQQMTSYPSYAADVEAFVSSLLMSEGLQSTLVHSHSRRKSTMLRFLAEIAPLSFRERCTESLLDLESRSLSTLVGKIDQSNHDLGLGREQLQFLRRAKNSSDFESGKGGTKFNDNTANWDADEDIMGDLH